MAQVSTEVPAFVTTLEAALARELRKAKIGYEQIRGNRYRFMIVWSKFDGMGHPERQQMVWDIADAVLSKKDLLNVGMIITLGAKE